jgi:hypothetical protein
MGALVFPPRKLAAGFRGPRGPFLLVIPLALGSLPLITLIDAYRTSEAFVFAFLEPPAARLWLRLAVSDVALAPLVIELIAPRYLLTTALTCLGRSRIPGLLREVPLLAALALAHIGSPLRVNT